MNKLIKVPFSASLSRCPFPPTQLVIIIQLFTVLNMCRSPANSSHTHAYALAHTHLRSHAVNFRNIRRSRGSLPQQRQERVGKAGLWWACCAVLSNLSECVCVWEKRNMGAMWGWRCERKPNRPLHLCTIRSTTAGAAESRFDDPGARLGGFQVFQEDLTLSSAAAPVSINRAVLPYLAAYDSHVLKGDMKRVPESYKFFCWLLCSFFFYIYIYFQPLWWLRSNSDGCDFNNLSYGLWLRFFCLLFLLFHPSVTLASLRWDEQRSSVVLWCGWIPKGGKQEATGASADCKRKKGHDQWL